MQETDGYKANRSQRRADPAYLYREVFISYNHNMTCVVLGEDPGRIPPPLNDISINISANHESKLGMSRDVTTTPVRLVCTVAMAL